MKRRLLTGAAALILTFVLSGCTVNIGNNGIVNRVEDTSEKSVSAGNIKSIDVVSAVGSIDVSTWDKDEILVKVTKVNNGFKSDSVLTDELKSAEVIYNQAGDKFEIKTLLPKFKNNGISIELDISVPKRLLSYNIESEVGDVKINDAQGQIHVVNNVGKIDIYNCSGNMDVKAITGDVTVRKCSLKGDSSITGNVGRVMFDGSIDNNGVYKMTTNVGELKVNLPSNSAFELDASTNVGNINCDFDVSGDKGKTSLHGKVNGGGAKLTLINNTGSISVNKE